MADMTEMRGLKKNDTSKSRSLAEEVYASGNIRARMAKEAGVLKPMPMAEQPFLDDMNAFGGVIQSYTSGSIAMREQGFFKEKNKVQTPAYDWTDEQQTIKTVEQTTDQATQYYLGTLGKTV